MSSETERPMRSRDEIERALAPFLAERIVLSIVFDPNDLEAAFAELDARYEALSREPFVPRIENVVMRSEAAFQRAWERRDWDAITALTPPGFRSIDRRPLMHIEVDRGTMLAGIRPFFAAGVERSSAVVATRGEHSPGRSPRRGRARSGSSR